jgi:hypothetical protein
MSICVSCHATFSRRDKQVSLNPDQRLCDDCVATGRTPAPESRQAMVVTRQVWTFTQARGLEQRTLPRRASAVRLDRERLPRWYIGPKDKALPRAAIYAAAAPDAALIRRVEREASERFGAEPWMA